MAITEDRVAAGAALFDRKRPDWFWTVDPDRLDVQSCENCPVGQLHDGRFNEGLKALGVSGRSAEFGFTPGESNELTNQAWRAALAMRRAAVQEQAEEVVAEPERELVLA
jgi:hypothetical protein